mmetsp:Transcript_49247/g.73278  ORF Transcript_49247/g.73278 Transcript_49247/m.73278 type:complete len:241 (+) Transcript_49247:133-855(+)|eukprot:CAMPEP_0195525370 /NCGR_PEP_ID=MMETSP0794_2-20130614/25799_1 /TAXON_ID=515487 /ORGANISM="Stephanopyxis turris, Strain CCMP 815" /LENGTH=240 /DNA_ID=CAMNT_0040655825 /DNA_START=123 /DNA_END=845 /DNA_ORIENTATION=+
MYRRNGSARKKGSSSSASNLASPLTSQAEREQALRDYKLTIEYKHLKQHAPGGVFLLPSMDDLRMFYGFIFVRRGPYANGVFKFQIRLPPQYNDRNAWPLITFSSFVYNPHVDRETGALDVKGAYPEWDPHKHYLVTVLTHLKKIFYMKNFVEDGPVANPEALDLAKNDPKEYRRRVESCVRESQSLVFVNSPGSTAKLTKLQPSHEELGKLLMEKAANPTSVSRADILDMVKEANQSEK